MSSSALTEQSFAELIAANGGRAYRVGGCVRDMIRGAVPKDIDFCVVDMVKKNFKTLFPYAEECGKYFPVFRLLIDGSMSEVAFARTERKEGKGYKGFKIASNPKITIEEDLFRRDLTVNSLAIDCLTGDLIDPFHGVEDIKKKVLRATSKHFSDDPIRALRLAGQAARLGYEIDADTLTMAGAVAGELSDEPVERIFTEMAKVFTQAAEPSRFFKVLVQTHLLGIVCKEMASLPADKFDWAMLKLDAAASVTTDAKLRFAVLGLVLDKGSLREWNSRMTLPADWLNAAIAAGSVMELLEAPSPEKIVTAINMLRRGSLSVEEFDILSQSEAAAIPELRPYKELFAAIQEQMPVELKGKQVGDWLRQKQIEAITKV